MRGRGALRSRSLSYLTLLAPVRNRGRSSTLAKAAAAARVARSELKCCVLHEMGEAYWAMVAKAEAELRKNPAPKKKADDVEEAKPRLDLPASTMFAAADFVPALAQAQPSKVIKIEDWLTAKHYGWGHQRAS